MHIGVHMERVCRSAPRNMKTRAQPGIAANKEALSRAPLFGT